jgi:hypothetical protein
MQSSAPLSHPKFRPVELQYAWYAHYRPFSFPISRLPAIVGSGIAGLENITLVNNRFGRRAEYVKGFVSQVVYCFNGNVSRSASASLIIMENFGWRPFTVRIHMYRYSTPY